MFTIGLSFFAIILIFLFVLIFKSVYLIRQAEAVVVERFGRYNRTLGPGLHIIVPFIEVPRVFTWSYTIIMPNKRYYTKVRSTYRVDLREAINDFPKQNVITKDNVNMEINALLYYQITDPKASVYEISNVPEAIEKLTQTTLRSVIGSMDLDETLSSRDVVNEKLRVILDKETDKWGVKVNRVELQEVDPPLDIRQAMEKQMRAERDRRAIIIESDGKKQAAVLQAEGQREASILRARGIAESKVIDANAEAEARLKVAEAESKAIEMIKSSAPDQDPLSYLATLNYIKVIPKMMEGKDDKLIVVPYEAAGLNGSIATLKKILTEVK